MDGKRRALAELERLEESLTAELARLTAEIRSEQKIAGQSRDASFAYGAYAAAAIARREKLVESITSVQEQTELTREEVATAYAELKRFELVQADRTRRVQERLARLDQAALDDIALGPYRRRFADRG
ncbi:MAG: flagellar FliJ family protein [Alphaproteobacteria bacterium]